MKELEDTKLAFVSDSLNFSISYCSSLLFWVSKSFYFFIIVDYLSKSSALFSASWTLSSKCVHFYLASDKSLLSIDTTDWSSSVAATSFYICLILSFLAVNSIWSSLYYSTLSYNPVITFWKLSLWFCTRSNLIEFSYSISNWSSKTLILSLNSWCFSATYSFMMASSYSFIPN